MPPTDSPHPPKDTEADVCFVIEGLLDLALQESSIQAFDARMAAYRCLAAYFNANELARIHFLNHAIELHSSDDGKPALRHLF